MPPMGLLSSVELVVTSMKWASHSSAGKTDLASRRRRPTTWNGACSSFHSTLASSIQKLGSRRRPQCVIRSVSRSWSPISNELIVAVVADVAHELVAQEIRAALKRLCRVVRIRNRRVLHRVVRPMAERDVAPVAHLLEGKARLVLLTLSSNRRGDEPRKIPQRRRPRRRRSILARRPQRRTA